MSGEAGGGDALLRERLIGTGVSVRDVDTILRAIAAADFVVVDAGRFERLQAECREILGGIYPEGAMYLEPGDLDPIERQGQ